MGQPAPLRSTVVQQVRTFLARHGAAVPPWSSVGEALDGLYALLHGRREDHAFWSELEVLMTSIAGSMQGSLRDDEREILSKASLAGLIGELELALGQSQLQPSRGVMSRFSAGRSAAICACISLLVAAVILGCSSTSSGGEPVVNDAATNDGGGTTDALADAFEGGSPQDVVLVIDAMIDADGGTDANAGRDGPAPAYKGVTFPSEKSA